MSLDMFGSFIGKMETISWCYFIINLYLFNLSKNSNTQLRNRKYHTGFKICLFNPKS